MRLAYGAPCPLKRRRCVPFAQGDIRRRNWRSESEHAVSVILKTRRLDTCAMLLVKLWHRALPATQQNSLAHGRIKSGLLN